MYSETPRSDVNWSIFDSWGDGTVALILAFDDPLCGSCAVHCHCFGGYPDLPAGPLLCHGHLLRSLQHGGLFFGVKTLLHCSTSAYEKTETFVLRNTKKACDMNVIWSRFCRETWMDVVDRFLWWLNDFWRVLGVPIKIRQQDEVRRQLIFVRVTVTLHLHCCFCCIWCLPQLLFVQKRGLLQKPGLLLQYMLQFVCPK